MTTRRGFLLGTGAALAMPSLARAAGAAPPSGAQGCMLMDGDGRVVDAQNADRLFIPASVTKSVTAFAALSLLRPDSRFATSLLADGVIDGSTLRGDLHLVGGGDPSLDTADLAGLAKRLRAKGIRQVSGNFLYHDTALPRVPMLNGVQPWQAGYNPALSGLNLNFNRALMKWSGKGKGLRVEGLAHADARTVAAGNVRFVPSETATSFGHRLEAGGEIWTVPRDMLGRAGQRWMPVRDPGGYAAATFRALAQEAGVRLPPALPATLPPPALAPLAVHRSDVLYALLTRMMKYSTNLTAEVVGTTAALQVGGAPANIADGAYALADWMRGAGQVFAPGADAGLRLVNHSGLSSESRATPRQIATILDRGVARLGGAFDSLHVSGEVTRDGRKMSRAHALRSKTGTMHFVRCLAGTLEVAGRPHVFAIMSCDEERRAETDAAFSPYDETRPRGARSWLRAALGFESATLARWVEEA